MRQQEQGFTLIELLIVVAIIAIIAALAATGLIRSRAAANEASAIASMGVTSSSERAFAVACGNGGFATSYLVLGTPPPGGGPGFISDDMSTQVRPVKSGYRFALDASRGAVTGPIDCHGGPTASGFYATAVPLSMLSGSRSFAVNTNGSIWQVSGGDAPAEPFGPPAMIIR